MLLGYIPTINWLASTAEPLKESGRSYSLERKINMLNEVKLVMCLSIVEDAIEQLEQWSVDNDDRFLDEILKMRKDADELRKKAREERV